MNYLVIAGLTAMGQYPGSGQVPIDPESIPKFVDFLPHFAGMRVKAGQSSNLIIKAVQTEQVAVSTGTHLDNGIVGTDPDVGKGKYFVYSISSDGGNKWTLPLWPSFTIEAQRNRELNVEVRNELHDLSYQDVNITVDQTIMMDGVPLTGNPDTDPYTGPVPIALHLHGGEVGSASDGGPHSWFTPGYTLKGKGWEQGVGPVLHYPNKQEAATLWYHEHSQLGLTRVNVYAGMAGFYFLRGLDEENARLPGWSKDDLVREVTPGGKVSDALHPQPYLPEIEIVIQDRMFDTKGQLYYPVDPPNPDVHPFWSPEFFGDVITVNGKTWPYLSVAPRKYRFHFLDGSNARFYNLWLQDLDANKPGPSLIQIGTDGGMLDSPVTIDPVAGKTLLLGPGERADIIIDFSAMAPGTVLTLMNDANTPFPDGDPVQAGTTDRIMQFVVNGEMISRLKSDLPGTDRSTVPENLRTGSLTKLTDFKGGINSEPDLVRQLTLNEVMSDNGPLMVLINNSRFEEMPGMMGMFVEVTEKPVEGTVEKWQLINMTMDAHPMHMHLVQFQLVSRQKFHEMHYMHNYMMSFTGVNGGMEGMYMGGEGPPFEYDVKNSDGAVGGNPSVSGYLDGPVKMPEANERGWKDVIIAYPGEVTTYLVRYAPTNLPVKWPKQLSLYPFDPSSGPGYVWHCHIVEHEDNDMMRPLNLEANPSRGKFKNYLENRDEKNTTLIDGFSLEQNSPNPFRSETEIRFAIPYDCHVELTLFNSAGFSIKKLIDAEAMGGNHVVRLSADGLPPGIYFYRLKAGEFISTRKLVVGEK